MNWIKKYLLSIIAIVISVIAMYLSIRIHPLSVDFDSAILVSVATILSAPTAILIAWQIFQVINIDRIINKEINKYKKEIDKKINFYEYETTKAFIIFACRNKDYELALKLSFFIPEYIIEGEQDKNLNVIDNVAILLNHFFDDAQKNGCSFSSEDLESFRNSYKPLAHFASIDSVLSRICQGKDS